MVSVLTTSEAPPSASRPWLSSSKMEDFSLSSNILFCPWTPLVFIFVMAGDAGRGVDAASFIQSFETPVAPLSFPLARAKVLFCVAFRITSPYLRKNGRIRMRFSRHVKWGRYLSFKPQLQSPSARIDFLAQRIGVFSPRLISSSPVLMIAHFLMDSF